MEGDKSNQSQENPLQNIIQGGMYENDQGEIVQVIKIETIGDSPLEEELQNRDNTHEESQQIIEGNEEDIIQASNLQEAQQILAQQFLQENEQEQIEQENQDEPQPNQQAGAENGNGQEDVMVQQFPTLVAAMNDAPFLQEETLFGIHELLQLSSEDIFEHIDTREDNWRQQVFNIVKKTLDLANNKAVAWSSIYQQNVPSHELHNIEKIMSIFKSKQKEIYISKIPQKFCTCSHSNENDHNEKDVNQKVESDDGISKTREGKNEEEQEMELNQEEEQENILKVQQQQSEEEEEEEEQNCVFIQEQLIQEPNTSDQNFSLLQEEQENVLSNNQVQNNNAILVSTDETTTTTATDQIIASTEIQNQESSDEEEQESDEGILQQQLQSEKEYIQSQEEEVEQLKKRLAENENKRIEQEKQRKILIEQNIRLKQEYLDMLEKKRQLKNEYNKQIHFENQLLRQKALVQLTRLAAGELEEQDEHVLSQQLEQQSQRMDEQMPGLIEQREQNEILESEESNDHNPTNEQPHRYSLHQESASANTNQEQTSSSSTAAATDHSLLINNSHQQEPQVSLHTHQQHNHEHAELDERQASSFSMQDIQSIMEMQFMDLNKCKYLNEGDNSITFDMNKNYQIKIRSCQKVRIDKTSLCANIPKFIFKDFIFPFMTSVELFKMRGVCSEWLEMVREVWHKTFKRSMQEYLLATTLSKEIQQMFKLFYLRNPFYQKLNTLLHAMIQVVNWEEFERRCLYDENMSESEQKVIVAVLRVAGQNPFAYDNLNQFNQEHFKTIRTSIGSSLKGILSESISKGSMTSKELKKVNQNFLTSPDISVQYLASNNDKNAIILSLLSKQLYLFCLLKNFIFCSSVYIDATKSKLESLSHNILTAYGFLEGAQRILLLRNVSFKDGKIQADDSDDTDKLLLSTPLTRPKNMKKKKEKKILPTKVSTETQTSDETSLLNEGVIKEDIQKQLNNEQDELNKQQNIQIEEQNEDDDGDEAEEQEELENEKEQEGGEEGQTEIGQLMRSIFNLNKTNQDEPDIIIKRKNGVLKIFMDQGTKLDIILNTVINVGIEKMAKNQTEQQENDTFLQQKSTHDDLQEKFDSNKKQIEEMKRYSSELQQSLEHQQQYLTALEKQEELQQQQINDIQPEQENANNNTTTEENNDGNNEGGSN